MIARSLIARSRFARWDRRWSFLAVVVLIALALQAVGLNAAVAQVPELTAYRISGDGDLNPGAAVWQRAPAVAMALTAQQSAWPGGGGSIPMLEARAIHTDTTLLVKLSWDDETLDIDPGRLDSFVDAAAIEFPAKAGSSVPSLCMGQSDNGVNIWHWQGGLSEGRPDSITELSEHGYVDRYPSTDDLYFPARASGNPVATPLMIEDLVAVGFGTLTPSTDQNVRGRAEWSNGHWQVVFARELSDASTAQIDLGQAAAVDVAFAVWDGAAGERNGKKSVSQFVVLHLAPEGPPAQGLAVIAMIAAAAAVGGLLLLQLGSVRRTAPPSSAGVEE